MRAIGPLLTRLRRGDEAVGRVEHEQIGGVEHRIAASGPGSNSCTPCSTATQLSSPRFRCTKLSEPVISVTATVVCERVAIRIGALRAAR